MLTSNVLSTGYNFIKKLLIYQPPRDPSPFVLDEPSDNKQPESDLTSGYLANSLHNIDALLRYAHRVTAFLAKANMVLRDGQHADKFTDLKTEFQALEKQQSELEPVLLAYQCGLGTPGERPITTSLEENRKIIEALYHVPLNKDIIIREIDIASDPLVRAMAIFIDGLVDARTQNLAILQPLMFGSTQRMLYDGDLVNSIIRKYLPTNQVQRVATFAKLQEAINSGDTALISMA